MQTLCLSIWQSLGQSRKLMVLIYKLVAELGFIIVLVLLLSILVILQLVSLEEEAPFIIAWQNSLLI